MSIEQLKVGPNIFKLRPPPHLHGRGVQVVYLNTVHGQQKGRVCRNDELTAVKPGRLLNKFCQLTLQLGGQTVLRLVQKI